MRPSMVLASEPTVHHYEVDAPGACGRMMGVRLRTLVLGLLCAGMALHASAEVRAVSETGRPGIAPAVAALQGGGFVVVWASPPSDLDVGAIHGRLVDDRGIPSGQVFQVSETPITRFGTARVPPVAVTALADGGFFAAWRFDGRAGEGEIFGRRFLAAGVAASGELRLSGDGELQVNADSRDDQRFPSAAGLGDGGLVVVWETASVASVRLHGRLFDSAAEPLTSDFPIAEGEPGLQFGPEIQPSPDGFVVRWLASDDRSRNPRPRERKFGDLGVALDVPREARSAPPPRATCSGAGAGAGSMYLRVWSTSCPEPGTIYVGPGTTIFEGDFEDGTTSAWSDRVPRTVLSITTPEAETCVNTDTPDIEIAVSGPFAVNVATLVLSANNTPFDADCTGGAPTIDCTPTEALAEGAVTMLTTANDVDGHPANPASVAFTVDTVTPDLVDLSKVIISPDGQDMVHLGGGPGAAEPNAIITIVNQTTPDSTNVTARADGSFLASLDGVADDTLALSQTDCAGNSSGNALVTVPGGGTTLPPDPETVAPPIDPTTPTDIHESTEFLYTGPDPIQTGVLPGAIDSRHVAVLRGRVLDRRGAPIPGVRVTCHRHSEFGQTLTRADSMFDLAVNGGGEVVVVYEKDGHLSVQRRVDTPWRDFAWAPDVVMVPLDTEVTTITSDATGLQVAQGTEVTDEDGTRQATVMVPAGTEAELVLSDGTTQSLSSLALRLTEFTVSAEGPAAMPGALPENIAYTWAAEISADEAIVAGASRVDFNQPIYLHLENFLDFPVGEPIPLGYYDRNKAAWVGSDDGRVIEILSVNGQGLAEIDVDGTGQPASATTLTALGFTDAERLELANRYAVGTTLWRAPIPHLTPWDANWPWAPPEDAEPPPPDDDEMPDDSDDPDPSEPVDPNDPDTPSNEEQEEDREEDVDCERGSVIGCQNQSLGKTIVPPGTDIALHYSSDRTPGYSAGLFVGIRLSGDTVPTALRRIDLLVEVGGQRIRQSFPPLPNQTFQFSWDANDPYGRRLQGERAVRITKRYCYDMVYTRGTMFFRSWGRFTSGPFESAVPSSRNEGEACLIRRRESHLGTVGPTLENWDSRGWGLGGWSIAQHHTYDPSSRTLYLGTGEHYAVQPFASTLQSVIDSGLSFPHGIALAPDGSLFIADARAHMVHRVAADGFLTTVAGTGSSCGDQETGNVETECGNSGPATQAQLTHPFDVAVETDGSLVIADMGSICIRRVSPAGIISTVAGDCVDQFLDLFTAEGLGHARQRIGAGKPCESCPATEETLSLPISVLPVPGGGFWVSEGGLVRKVTPDGFIEREVGDPEATSLGDGGPAREALLNDPQGLALDAQGNLYIADRGHHRVRRVSPSGVITTFAGNGSPVFEGDGEIADMSGIGSPHDIVVRRDGIVFITVTSSNGARVLRVDGSGKVYTVIGGGILDPRNSSSPIRAVELLGPWGMVEAPDGTVHFADSNWAAIFQATEPLPGYSGEELRVPSRSGAVVYEFDIEGRHLRTIDALTGADRYTFGYDGARLVTVTDGDGRITVIERDGTGKPTAIVGPYGHSTALELDPNGWLSEVISPAGHNDQFTYTADGLLLSHTDPRGGESVYTYLPSGQLKTATDRAGTTTTLTRFGFDEDYRVVLQTPLEAATQFHVNNLATNEQTRTKTTAAGFATTRTHQTDGRNHLLLPSGTIVETLRSGDPRFGMAAPLVTEYIVTSPEGRVFALNRTRAVTLSEPLDPLSLTTMTEQLAVNSRAYVKTFDVGTRTFTATTPSDRLRVVEVDEQARPVTLDIPTMSEVLLSYDEDGRLDVVRQGSGANERILDVRYDSQGRMESLIDSVGRLISYSYDSDDRLRTQSGPGNRVVTFSYDENENLVSVTPPGRPSHTFSYTPDDLLELYDPPDAGFSPDTTIYSYDLDRRLDLIVRPDGAQIDPEYDDFGRPFLVTFPTGSISYGYSPMTGDLETITGPGGQVITYLFDGALPTSTVFSGVISGVVERSFTADFWLESESVNDDEVTFEYDDDGLLTRAGALTLERDTKTGVEVGTTLGLITTFRSAEHVFGEIDQLTAAFNGTEIFRIDFTERDKLGRIVGRVETINGTSVSYFYQYDDAGRLESVSKDGAPYAVYTYDENGNRLGYEGPFGSVNNTSYDEQDRLREYGDAVFAYTANGELKSRTENGQVATYVYDALGHLRSVTLPDGISISYVLDGRGRRVGKRIGATLVKGFLYRDLLNPVAELDGSGKLVSRFVYGSRAHVPDYMVKEGLVYRLISDHLGSVRFVVNVSTGVIEQHLDYDEYGRVLLDTSPGFQPFGFAGGIYDYQTGLVRFGARDYDPSVGRWTIKDPSGLVNDPNLYAYASNDPLNRFDPEGQAAIFIVPAVIALVAITVAVVVIVSSPEYQKNAREAAEGLQEWWRDRVVPLPMPFPAAPNEDLPGYFDERCTDPPSIPFPGWDPAKAPGEDWVWKGRPPEGGAEGAWHNPATGESLHPDLAHPQPIGPHWDYIDGAGDKWRIGPGGDVTRK